MILHYLTFLKKSLATKTMGIHISATSYSKTLSFPSPCNLSPSGLLRGRGAHPLVPDAHRLITLLVFKGLLRQLPSICWSESEVTLFHASFKLAFYWLQKGLLCSSELDSASCQDNSGQAFKWQNVSTQGLKLHMVFWWFKTGQKGWGGGAVCLQAPSQDKPCPVHVTKEYLFIRLMIPAPLLKDGTFLTRFQFTSIL